MTHKIARGHTIAAAAVAVSVAAALLAACTTNPGSTSGPKASAGSTQKVTLEFWSGIPAAVQAADAYNASQTNVTVNVSNPPDASSKLATALKAGAGAPDVAGAQYTDMPQLIGSGGLADLAPLWGDLQKSEYLPYTWNLVGTGTHYYGIPEDIGPTALVYRKDVLEKYNVPVPTTWAEFADAAQKIYDASKGATVIANFPGNYADWYLGLSWQRGGKPWTRTDSGDYTQNFDNAAARDVADYLQPLLDKGLLTTIPQFSADLYSALAQGKIATSIEAAWGAGGWAQNVPASTKDLWRVADLPQVGSGTFAAANAGGSALVIPKQGTHQKESVDFAKWLTSSLKGTQTQYDISGTFSASKTGQSLPDFSDPTKNPSNFFGGQNVSKVYEKAAAGVDQTFVYAPWYKAATDDFVAAFNDAISKKTTLRAALTTWQDKVMADAKSQGFKVTVK